MITQHRTHTGTPASAGLPDTTLLAALQNRDEVVVASLVKDWHPLMLRMALRYVATHELAEEVIQATWLAVLKGLPRFAGRSSLQTWTIGILIKQAQTLKKRNSRVIAFSELEAAPWTDENNAQDAFLAQRDAWFLAGRTPLGGCICPDEPETVILTRETIHYLHQAIASLATTQRAVIILHDLEGWTPSEICAQLHLSAANVRVLLHRARRKVQQALTDYLH